MSRIYVGSYTEYAILAHSPNSSQQGQGIYSLLFEENTLKCTSVTPTINPAVLLHKNDTLYVMRENINGNGGVSTYSTKSTELEYVNECEMTGASTCYMAIHPNGKYGVIVNYWDSVIDVVNIENGGMSVKASFQQKTDRDWYQVGNREEHWKNRQVGPHAHSAHFWGQWVFIPDLGENAIFQYRYDDECELTFEALIPLDQTGAGPRHLVINKAAKTGYISNELNGTLSVVRFDDASPELVKKRLSIVQNVETLPTMFDTPNYVAEVDLSPDGKFVYVSNRGHDSLAIFNVAEDGLLSFVDIVSTGGKCPRHFAISPCGEYLVVANQDSSLVKLFKRDVESGLIDAVSEIEVPTPCFVHFH